MPPRRIWAGLGTKQKVDGTALSAPVLLENGCQKGCQLSFSSSGHSMGSPVRMTRVGKELSHHCGHPDSWSPLNGVSGRICSLKATWAPLVSQMQVCQLSSPDSLLQKGSQDTGGLLGKTGSRCR